MITKNIDQIIEQDLRNLVDNSVLESKTIEYKKSLTVNEPKEKKEFLADVSSFANASGGDLIYGISVDKNTQTPISLDGLSIQNIDKEMQTLENIIRDGIQPRISSIIIQPVSLSNSNVALIIRVPKSWNMPHRVTFQGHDKFFSRNSNGKYPLDVGELRTLFNLSETLGEKIKRFREDRISSIISNESFIPLSNGPKIVLHLIPLISLTPGQRYDLGLVKGLQPMSCDGWNNRYNLDGFLVHSGREESDTYAQLFRNGIIEAVNGRAMDSERSLISGRAYESDLIKSLKEYLISMQELNIEPPILLFLSLLNVKGYSISMSRFMPLKPSSDYKIDRDIILLPEAIIENYSESADIILKPCFDSICNACGLSKSPNYDEDGRWKFA